MNTLLRSSFLALAALPVCYPQAVITTVAGNGTLVSSGDGGPATKAGIGLPTDVAFDSAGNLYIVEYGNNRIRKVDTTGKISTFAGNGKADYSGVAGPSPGDGGPATSAEIPYPLSVAVDRVAMFTLATPVAASQGRHLGHDQHHQSRYPGRVWLLTRPGTCTSATRMVRRSMSGLWAGRSLSLCGGAYGFSGDGGPATKAAIDFPSGVAVDAKGNLYFADKTNNRVRKVDTKGVITTFAGTGKAGFSGDGGPATSAKLGLNLTSAFQGVAVDSAGNVYIADPQNNRIRMVNTAGIISTFAGNGTAICNRQPRKW